MKIQKYDSQQHLLGALSRVLSVLIFVFLSTGLSGCVSGAKRLAQLDQALQDPNQLEKLCSEGVTGACALRGEFKGVGHQVPIMQGVSSANASRFIVIVPKKEKLVYYARSSQGAVKLNAERVTRAHSPMASDQVEAFNLNPREKYQLIVINSDGLVWDRRDFRALDTANTKAKIAIASCMDDSMTVEQAAMWKQLLSEKPDVLLMIGDNVYVDRIPGGWAKATKEQLWDRYVDTRTSLDFFRAQELVPVFATWDDHDFGRNDADRTYEFKEESAAVFQAFFAQSKPAADFVRGPGVSSWWNAYGVQFGLLDDRSFRSPNKVDLPDQTHFGSAQEDWIADRLANSKQPVFLVSGDQFFGGYHPFESYEGSHPTNFAAQLARWKKTSPPILFVSGDRHLTEIIRVPHQKLGYATYELTSSALHAKTFAEAFDKNPSPYQLAGVAGIHNYMLLEVLKATPKVVQVRVRSVGPQKQNLFEKTLTVKK